MFLFVPSAQDFWVGHCWRSSISTTGLGGVVNWAGGNWNLVRNPYPSSISNTDNPSSGLEINLFH